MLELLKGGLTDLGASAARHGEGLFETIKVREGVPLRLEAHLERLAVGAAFLGMEAPPAPADVRAFLEACTPCGTLKEGVLRLVAVDRQLQVRVEAWSPDTPAEVAVALSEGTPRLAASPLNRFKTLSYLENRILAKEAQARGLFEVIALNERGRLTDGSRTTLFVAGPEGLLTPPVEEGALPGVARRALLEAGLAREAPLDRKDLMEAPALLLTNALRGGIPVDRLGERRLDPRHPLLARARELLR